MASAELLRVTHIIDNKVTGIAENVKAVDDKVQKMAVGRERLFSSSRRQL
jgi:hypothetical protein